MTEVCNWPLGNGQSLEFQVVAQNNGWNKVAGLYIFAYRQGNMWYPIYAGQTDDFSVRLPNHERLNEAIQKGATHIHVAVIPDPLKRKMLEQMLIQSFQPPLNVHYT